LDELTRRKVKLSLGGSIYDPTDPVGRLLFNVLAMVAKFQSDPIKMRIAEGMRAAKAKGRRLGGKQPKLKRKEADPPYWPAVVVIRGHRSASRPVVEPVLE
jgi:DNA invertase Pin-like site-specific DNA recombinase